MSLLHPGLKSCLKVQFFRALSDSHLRTVLTAPVLHPSKQLHMPPTQEAMPHCSHASLALHMRIPSSRSSPFSYGLLNSYSIFSTTAQMSLLREAFLSCLPSSTQGGQGLSWIQLRRPQVPVCGLGAQHTFTEWRTRVPGGRRRPPSLVLQMLSRTEPCTVPARPSVPPYMTQGMSSDRKTTSLF